LLLRYQTRLHLIHSRCLRDLALMRRHLPPLDAPDSPLPAPDAVPEPPVAPRPVQSAPTPAVPAPPVPLAPASNATLPARPPLVQPAQPNEPKTTHVCISRRLAHVFPRAARRRAALHGLLPPNRAQSSRP
jgi:hypothetical protein